VEQLVRKYLCENDNGAKIKVCEYQEMLDATSLGDPHRKYVPGLKRLQLETGGAANFIDAKTFEVVATGEKLRVTEWAVAPVTVVFV
jgi:hypothetical protein